MDKFVILSPAHPLRGGIAASSERQAQEFQARNYQVTIYSFSLQYPSFLFPGKTQFTSDPPPPDITIKTLVNSISPINWVAVGRQLKKARPDLIVVRYWLPFMGPSLGTILRIAKTNRKSVIVALADNVIPHEARPGDRWFTRYFIGAVDGFVVMSRQVEQDIRQFTASKPVLFSPHPIYDSYGPLVEKRAARHKLGLDPAGKYLLFFGFIRDYKGLDLLLEAMSDARLEEQDIRLIIAGEYYSKADHYQNTMKTLGVSDRIIQHTDFIPNEMVKYYFGAADLIVQPYKSATQSGISQLAYHFEKPIVVTKVGGLPEIVLDGKTGYTTNVDTQAIADAIVDFYENDKSAEFTEEVRKRKHLFSWTNMVDRFETLYQKLR